jgi:ferric-dicitrate binding protein FerR (iron transport regulator)
MSAPHLAKLAMRALADDAPLPAAPSKREADAAIAAIAAAIAEVAAKRRRRSRVLGGLALAATLLLAIGTVASLRRDKATPTASVEDVKGGVLLVRGDDGVKLGRGAGIGKGDRVVASAEGVASLRLRNGTELRAARGADVAFLEQGPVQIYELRAGTVHLHVAKLVAGERFLVRTGDAEVEVRGTEFDVDVREPCEGTTTRVAVREGTVVVRHAGAETRVTVGESWPAACGERGAAAPGGAAPGGVAPGASSLAVAPAPGTSAPPGVDGPVAVAPALGTSAPPGVDGPVAAAPTSPPPRPAGTAVVVTPASTPAATPAPRDPAPVLVQAPPLPAPAASSPLSEQNRLFADAMACKRRGDVAGSLAALDGLIAAYPRGTLAESAQVEKMRVLAGADRRRAGDAARAYLARYPNGYARDEARALTSR